MEKILITVCCIFIAFASGFLTNFFRSRENNSGEKYDTDSNTNVEMDGITEHINTIRKSKQRETGTVGKLTENQQRETDTVGELTENQRRTDSLIEQLTRGNEDTAELIRRSRELIESINKDNNLDED